MTEATIGGQSGSEKPAEWAREHPVLVTIARTGWLAKGLVYALVGVLAVPIALRGLGVDEAGDGGDEASQVGVVSKLAESRGGAAVLVVVAVGLALYVLWRVVSIILPAENSASGWATRVGYAVSAAVYTSLAWSAVSFARHGGSSGESGSENARVERVTRQLMEMTGGRWLLGLAGGGLVAIGLYFVRKGVTASFRRELEPGGVGPLSEGAIVGLGRVGWVGRGVMMGLIGWFLVRAAITFDPDEAHGLDGALRDATRTTLGAVLAIVVAFGLIVYGMFCVASAPRARLIGAEG